MSNEVMPGLIRRSNLVEMVHDAIEKAVQRGELKAGGCEFTEAALCKKFNVSRPTVREALIRLRAKGALAVRGEVSGFGGAPLEKPVGAPRYRPLSSITDLSRHFEFRRSIELGAVGHCALRRDAAELARIEAAFHALHRGTHGGTTSADADFRFHLAIARASGNAMFVSVMEALRAHVLFTMNLSRQFTHEHAQAQHSADVDHEHRMIVEAILDRDERRARAAMQSHIGKAAARVFGDRDKEWQPMIAAA